MNNDRLNLMALYESIYAGTQAFGGDEEDTEKKDDDTSSDNDEIENNESDENEFKDSEDSENESEDTEDSEAGEDSENESGDDEDSEDDGKAKGDGTFASSVESLRKQYSDLLAKVFGEFAPAAIEQALDNSDGPFGDNIQTIIQTAIEHLKNMIYDEFELEDLNTGITPSAMGSFDPNAALDMPMELEIGGETDFEPDSEEDETDNEEHESQEDEESEHESEDDNDDDKELSEKLSSKSKTGTWIKDFEKSDAPQFKGKSKEKRAEMAIAAKYASKK